MIERLGPFAIGVVLAWSWTSSGDTAYVDGATVELSELGAHNEGILPRERF